MCARACVCCKCIIRTQRLFQFLQCFRQVLPLIRVLRVLADLAEQERHFGTAVHGRY